MKRAKQLTKRERKALAQPRPATATGGHTHAKHIHCIACGRHLDPADFDLPVIVATRISCQHGSTFPTCVACVEASKRLLAEHDRTGQPVRVAAAWH